MNKRVFIILVFSLLFSAGCTQPKSLRRALIGMTDRYMCRASLRGGDAEKIAQAKKDAWQTARLAAALYPDDADAVLAAAKAGLNSGRDMEKTFAEIHPLEPVLPALRELASMEAREEEAELHVHREKIKIRLPLSDFKERLVKFADAHPEIPHARIFLGKTAFEENKFDEALSHLKKAYESNPRHPGARGAYAIALMKVGEWEKAGKLFRAHARDAERHDTPLSFLDEAAVYACLRFGSPIEMLRRLEPEMVRANMGADRCLALAITALRASRPQTAYRIYRAAKEQGFEKSFPDLLRLLLHYQFLRNLKDLKLYPAGALAARRALEEFPDNAAFNYFLGHFLEFSDQPGKALFYYRKSETLAPMRTSVAAAMRRLSARKGMYREGVDRWLEVAPRDMIFAEENRFKKRFEKLLECARVAQEDPTADAVSAYGEACLAVGWTEEAAIAFEAALEIEPSCESALQGLQGAKNHQKLIERLTNYMESNYRRARRDGVVLSIKEVLDDMEDIARACVLLPPQKEEPLYSVALFGAEVCPISRPGGALVSYFLSHSQYLELQQTPSGSVECKLMSLDAVLDRKVKANGREIPYSVWVCGRSLIRGSAGQLGDGGHIAGSASYSTNGFFVEMESVEPDFVDFRMINGEESVPPTPLEMYRRKRFEEREKSNPFAVTSGIRKAFGEGVLKYSLPENSSSYTPEVRAALYSGEFENVAFHELGHVLDFKRLMPAWRHPLRGTWIVISHGFSPLAIATRFETVAELSAMAKAGRPHVGLNELLGWLDTEKNRPYFIRLLAPDREPVEYSPYHGMAKRICEVMMEYIEDNPGSIPGLGARGPRLADVPMLKPEDIRKAARNELSGYGINY